MLDEHQRIAILQLKQQGFGTRRIARALKISRSAVCDVLASGDEAAKNPSFRRRRSLTANKSWSCTPTASGNLVRVHEELMPRAPSSPTRR